MVSCASVCHFIVSVSLPSRTPVARIKDGRCSFWVKLLYQRVALVTHCCYVTSREAWLTTLTHRERRNSNFLAWKLFSSSNKGVFGVHYHKWPLGEKSLHEHFASSVSSSKDTQMVPLKKIIFFFFTNTSLLFFSAATEPDSSRTCSARFGARLFSVSHNDENQTEQSLIHLEQLAALN